MKRFLKLRYVLLVCAALFAAVFAAGGAFVVVNCVFAHSLQRKSARIVVGMKKKDILRRLGNPEDAFTRDGREVLEYSRVSDIILTSEYLSFELNTSGTIVEKHYSES